METPQSDQSPSVDISPAPAVATPAAQPNNLRNNILVPAAILLGFGLIAAAIFFRPMPGTSGTLAGTGSADTERVQPTNSGDPENVAPVTEDDHIRGNPNAPITIVEYSDFDCPFCKNFHETMNQIMAEYGTDGKVAWVYRHFPLQQLHPNAAFIAHASECVAELGGNDAFWEFSDLVFGERGTNEPTNLTRLQEFAISSGVNGADFMTCAESNRHQAAVEADYNNAIAVGGRGTPHSILIIGDQTGVINGAQPYSAVKQIVDNLLAQIEGQG